MFVGGRWMCCGLVIAFGTIALADDRPLRDVIDVEIAAGWEANGIAAAPPASDAEFLRRIHLDLTGLIPAWDQTNAFLDSPSPDKRPELIDQLLASDRHAVRQADLWDLILFGRNAPGHDTDRRDGFRRWLVDQFSRNRPWDEMVRELLRAEGNSVEQGPPLYYAQYRNQPEDLNEVVTQTFLGVQLQCARCHDHPFESWTQLDFYGMAAFFARLEIVSVGTKDNLTMYAVGEKSTGDVLFTGPAREQKPGQKGEPVKPKFLLGEPLAEPPLPEGFKEIRFEGNKPPPAPVFSRKDELAAWIARAENPFFARAIANRIWAQYMGRGLVHPVDNMSASNPPSHPKLLDALASWLISHKFDLKAYSQEIVTSRTYQLSSRGSTGEAQPQWFQHARSRPLSAEELVESWRIATGYEASEINKPPEQKKSRHRPLDGYLISFLGQPNNGVGEFQGGLLEHLYLNNGPLDGLITSAPGGLLDTISKPELTPEQRVDRLFRQVLNRSPTDVEQARFMERLSTGKDSNPVLRNMIWALMTCSEFRFNH